jgi:hypothetical protein
MQTSQQPQTNKQKAAWLQILQQIESGSRWTLHQSRLGPTLCKRLLVSCLIVLLWGWPQHRAALDLYC